MRKFKLHVLVIFSIFLILILTNYKINLNASVNNDSKIEQEKLDSDNKSKEESQVSINTLFEKNSIQSYDLMYNLDDSADRKSVV